MSRRSSSCSDIDLVQQSPVVVAQAAQRAGELVGYLGAVAGFRRPEGRIGWS